MDKYNIVFIETEYSNLEILGRRAKDYVLREFSSLKCESSRIVKQDSLKKIVKMKDAINIILPLDMPLVSKDDIFRVIKRMQRHRISHIMLGKEPNIGKITIGDEGECDVFAPDEAFLRIDSAKSFNVVYNHIKERINDRLIDGGVNIIDTQSTFIDDTVEIESGATIYPFSRIEGKSVILSGASVYSSYLKDTSVGTLAKVEMSYAVNSSIGARSSIGPFARLRGASIENDCRIGDFVEVKASILRDGVKASHLSYIGDADVGERTNVGCGSVFCNYDGVKKNKTTVGSDCFIGANTNLIAPLVVGDHAFIAAGTTVTRDVQDDSFTIGRVRQDTVKRT